MATTIDYMDPGFQSENRDCKRRQKPLQILLICPMPPSMTGAVRDWVNLANSCNEKQVQITWASATDSESLRSFLTSKAVIRLVDLHYPLFNYLLHENAIKKRSYWLWTKILVDHLMRSRKALWLACSALKRMHFDLIVSNTITATFGSILGLIWRLPHVWCIKECLDLRVEASRKYATWISRTSSAVIVPSKAAARPFPGRVHVIPDGNDLAAVRTYSRTPRSEVVASLRWPQDRPIVAQIGGINWLKGQHITTSAFSYLAAKGGQPPFSLLFLGDGGNPYHTSLIEMVEKLPQEWREAVRFAHYRPGDYSYIAAADLVVHPSVLADTLPNAIREAMILGKPVIGSRIGGIPEMIEHNRTGIIVPPQDPIALAEAMSNLISHPSESSRIGIAAEQYAMRQFDIDTQKHAFLRLFRAVVA